MKLRLLTIFCFITFLSFAQEKWSLQDCLDYASENNISIKQANLTSILSENQLVQSKLNLLPSINVNASHSLNFGRAIDPYTNSFSIDRVRNNNLGASSNIVLFSGFQNLNNIRKSQYDYLASQYETREIANNISINIVTAFLQLMYSKELVEVHEDKLKLSKLQVDRISKMVEVGRLPKGSLLETESQMAQEELQLVNVRNQLDFAYLNIKQLLDLDVSVIFDIILPEINLSDHFKIRNTEDLYQSAIINLPDLKSSINKVKSAERSLAIAQGGRSPQLILSGSIGTGYSDASKKIDPLNNTLVNYPFDEQLEDNINQSVSLSVSIPIFNGFQISNSISQAKVAVLQAEYSLHQTENELRKEIEQANSDALAAHKKYLASNKSVQALSESFSYTQEKYNVEFVSTYEYNDAKNRLFKAESDLLEAKYDYVFKIKILDFYTGNKLTF